MLRDLLSEAMAFGTVNNIYGDDPKHEKFHSEILISIPVETTDDPNVIGCLSWDEEKKNFRIVINQEKTIELFSKFINAPIENDLELGMKEEYVIHQRKVAALRAILKHEILHYALLHWSYKLNECERLLANIAQDSVINLMITEFHHITPKYLTTVTPYDLIAGKAPERFVLMNDPLKNESWLEIFEKLRKSFICEEYTIRGFTTDYDYAEEHMEEAERVIKRALASGEIPDDILEELESLEKDIGGDFQSLSRIARIGKSRQIKWTSILRKFFKDMRIYEWHATWKRPSKRFGSPPAMKFRYRGSQEVTVMIDVSGSISKKQLEIALSEISRLARLYEVTGWIYTYDVRIHDKIRLKDVIRGKKIEFHGGGGTSLENALNEIRDLLAKNVVVFTDGFDNLVPHSFLENRKFLFIYYTNYNYNHRKAMEDLGAWTTVLREHF